MRYLKDLFLYTYPTWLQSDFSVSFTKYKIQSFGTCIFLEEPPVGVKLQ